MYEIEYTFTFSLQGNKVLKVDISLAVKSPLLLHYVVSDTGTNNTYYLLNIALQYQDIRINVVVLYDESCFGERLLTMNGFFDFSPLHADEIDLCNIFLKYMV